MKLKSRSSLLAIAFALILGVIIGGTAVAATQVHMRNALSDLESAASSEYGNRRRSVLARPNLRAPVR
jgi:hypothetical protein